MEKSMKPLLVLVAIALSTPAFTYDSGSMARAQYRRQSRPVCAR